MSTIPNDHRYWRFVVDRSSFSFSFSFVIVFASMALLMSHVDGVQPDVGDRNATEIIKPVCLVFNWEMMTCTWPVTQDNLQLKFFKHYLCLCENKPSILETCPVTTNGSCTFMKQRGYIPRFSEGVDYCMWLMTDSNKAHSCTKVSPKAIVKPNRVSVISVTNVSSHSVRVEWEMPNNRRREVRCNVRLRSKSSRSFSEHSKLVDFRETIPTRELEDNFTIREKILEKVVSIDLVDLIPHTLYDAIVQCIPLVEVSENSARRYASGTWSDPSNVAEFQTAEYAPSMSPVVTSGSFSRLKKSGELHIVEIYWKPIPDECANGIIIKNLVECCAIRDATNSSECSSTAVGNDRFSAVLELDARTRYDCTVKSANSKYDSPASRRIIVLGNDYVPTPIPYGLVVVYDDKAANLTWTSTDTGDADVMFTVYWCSVHSFDSSECHGKLEWANVAGYTFSRVFEYVVKPTTYRFAVSAEEDRPHIGLVSSGLHWTSCVKARYDDTVAKTIVHSYQEQDFLVVTLTNQNDCLVTVHYVIDYWLKDDSQQRGKIFVNGSRGENVVKLKLIDLDVGAEYRMRVTSWLSLGEVEYRGVVEHSPVVLRNQPGYLIMLVVPATAILCLITIILLIRFKWSYMKNRFLIPIAIPDVFKVDIGHAYLESGCSSVTDSTSAGELSPTSETIYFDFNLSNEALLPESNVPMITKLAPAINNTPVYVLPRIPDDALHDIADSRGPSEFCNYASNLLFSSADDEEVDADDERPDGYTRPCIGSLPKVDGQLSGSNVDVEDQRKEENYYIPVLLNSDDEISISPRDDVDAYPDGVIYVRDLIFDADEDDELEASSSSSSSSASSTVRISEPAPKTMTTESGSHPGVGGGVDDGMHEDVGDEDQGMSSSYCSAKIF